MENHKTQIDEGMATLINTGMNKQNQLDKELKIVKDVC